MAMTSTHDLFTGLRTYTYFAKNAGRYVILMHIRLLQLYFHFCIIMLVSVASY